MTHNPRRVLRPTCTLSFLLAAVFVLGAPLPAAADPAPPTATPPATDLGGSGDNHGTAPVTAPAPTGAPGSPDAPAAAAPLTRAQVSFLFGLEFGEQMNRVGISNQVTVEDIARGMNEGLHGRKTTPEEQQQVAEFAHAQMLAGVTANKAAGRDFLAKNAKDKGVKTTASGLQYKVLIPGDTKAPSVTPTDEVTVQYRGKLIDGTEFDSSYAHGAPVTFKANAVIKGWQEALLLMKPGAKWQLFVPTELAYDASPRPGIPAGSTLIFEVELQKVQASDPAKERPAHMMPTPRTPSPNQ